MFVLTFVLSALRLWATGEHYGASMTVWQSLDEGKRSVEPGTVCVGKEWYRYPSSYFLPANMRLRFIQSEFDGLLPGTFIEVPKGTSPARQGRFAETFHRPGFSASRGDYNGRNAWAADKIVDVETCDYLVDLDFPARYTEGQAPSLLEPRYVQDTEKWEKIRCERFLDVEKTPAMLRRLWLGEDDRRVWGDYCLLKAKRE
jgi:alpha-1,2-mannosyltransferase